VQKQLRFGSKASNETTLFLLQYYLFSDFWLR